MVKITVEYLLQKIGQLVIENEMLQKQLAEKNEQKENKKDNE